MLAPLTLAPARAAIMWSWEELRWASWREGGGGGDGGGDGGGGGDPHRLPEERVQKYIYIYRYIEEEEEEA